MKKLTKTLLILSLGLSLCACGEIKDPEALDDLQTFNDTIESLDIESSYSLDINLDENNEFLKVYSYTADDSAHFKAEIDGFKQAKNMEIYYEIIDDNSNLILELTNKKRSKYKGEFDLVAGKTYYICWSATGSKKESCTLNIKTEKTETEIKAAQLKDTLTKKIKSDSYQVAYYNPEKDGYYYIKLVSDQTASIYSILKNGEEEIEFIHGICKMEKDNTYYIVYGVEELETKTAKITLSCEYLNVIEADEVVTIEEDSIIYYMPEKDDEIVVYTISEENPTITVYDYDDILAQNNNADGLFSENKKDAAVLLNAKKGKEYFIHISNINSPCEVHIKEYEEEK